MAASICFKLPTYNLVSIRKLPQRRYSYKTTATNGQLNPILHTGNPPTFVSVPNRRLIAVGDLHGDLSKARWALNLAGVLSSDGQNTWTGGHTVVIQLGDILDRGQDEIAILSLLRSLDMQARPQGGAVFQVNGNHETMNVERDFRYVYSGGFDECADFLEYLGECDHNWEQAFVTWIDVSAKWKEDRKKSRNHWGPWKLVERQRGVIARSLLFQPGGPLARELARHPVVLKVDDWVFCHGGLLPHHGTVRCTHNILFLCYNPENANRQTYGCCSVSYGIERLNNQVSSWMRGEHETNTTTPIPFITERGYDSVVWNRLYSRDISDLEDYQINQIHTILEETLQAIGAKAMVVGHTPQTQGVNCEFNCSIWRIDVGMSSGVLDSRPEILEILDDKARAIRGKGDTASELQVLSYM